MPSKYKKRESKMYIGIYIYMYIKRPKKEVMEWCDKSYLDVVMVGRRGLA